jgi:hypothetical protein
MTHETDQLMATGVLRAYRFESHAPVAGKLAARLRAVWYNAAARWGDESIIAQQTACNQMLMQHIAVLEQQLARHEQRLAQQAQHISEQDERLILADRDLTDLIGTVGELTQQVILLRHTVEELRAASRQA